MAQPKPLFVPWLCQQIQSGIYPGVCWTNKELQQFSIPWKHALRQDSNSDDVLIFKAWAQTSASGDGRINGDPSVWKRNFRSALRAKHFKMIFDNKNDAANPHKVYQFPSDPPSAAPSGSEESQETDFSPELYLEEENIFSKNPRQGLEGQFTGLNLHESPSHVHEVWDQDQLYLGLEEQVLLQEMTPCSEAQLTEMACFQAVDTAFSSAGGAVGGLGQISPTQAATAVNHHSPVDQPAPCPPDGEGDPAGVLEPKLETFFRVKVYYKGKMVLEQFVENDTGFRLMYQGNMDEPSADLPVVRLPPPEDILDQIQARLTNEILGNLGGLEIRRLNGVVLGQRWGSSRIYWGPCKHEKSQTARELSKNAPKPIFYLKDFITGLMKFMETSGESPSYTLYFFLGEKWPDPKMKPWEKKLIMIEVVLTSPENLKMLAVNGGASSLQSVELQLSLEQMMELC